MQLDDLFPRLIRGRPEIGIRLRIVGEPGQRATARATEYLAEVAELDTRYVLDEAEEVRPGRGHRSTDVVLPQSVEFRQKIPAANTQVSEQVRFVIHLTTLHQTWDNRVTVGLPRRARVPAYDPAASVSHK